jgi:hypothetical protein
MEPVSIVITIVKPVPKPPLIVNLVSTQELDYQLVNAQLVCTKPLTYLVKNVTTIVKLVKVLPTIVLNVGEIELLLQNVFAQKVYMNLMLKLAHLVDSDVLPVMLKNTNVLFVPLTESTNHLVCAHTEPTKPMSPNVHLVTWKNVPLVSIPQITVSPVPET